MGGGMDEFQLRLRHKVWFDLYTENEFVLWLGLVSGLSFSLSCEHAWPIVWMNLRPCSRPGVEDLCGLIGNPCFVCLLSWIQKDVFFFCLFIKTSQAFSLHLKNRMQSFVERGCCLYSSATIIRLLLLRLWVHPYCMLDLLHCLPASYCLD